MIKETITISIIVSLIIVANTITQKYTKQSIDTMSGKLIELRQIILTEEQKNKENLIEKYEVIQNTWDGIYDKLAYYIEHDELEKVETDLKSVKSNVEIEEYTHTISDIDKCVFILEHIQDKEKLNLKNIF